MNNFSVFSINVEKSDLEVDNIFLVFASESLFNSSLITNKSSSTFIISVLTSEKLSNEISLILLYKFEEDNNFS